MIHGITMRTMTVVAKGVKWLEERIQRPFWCVRNILYDDQSHYPNT